MISFRLAGRHMFRTLTVFLILAAVSACVAQETQATASTTAQPAASAAVPVAAETAQPRLATYKCGSGGAITVENRGDTVHVVSTDGEAIDLPAAPAAQRSRYGAGADAIVIEGREALFMHGRHPPLTCTR